MFIQEIRARQVLEEEGLNLNIKIEHSEIPKTLIGNREYSLIFPKFMFNYETNKTIDILFVGKITPQRKEFLNNFNATIINSNRGRNKETKAKDEEYFKIMSKAKFVLCPNGSFIWTYRFFEAIVFKAIPIIEENCSLYDGYKFYKKNDKPIYRKDWIEHNLKKLKREMTWI
jgi:hypothetical protein